jgi:retron-type reverse transcriptase
MSWINQIKKSKKTGYYNSLYKVLCSKNILRVAFYKIKHNSKNSDLEFDEPITLSNLDDYIIDKIEYNLKCKSFKFTSIKKINVQGTTKAINIPTIYDKIVQKAIVMILESIYEPKFSDFSYGFRPNRNRYSALKKISRWTNTTWVINGTLANTFDKNQFQKLVSILKRLIKDNQFIDLIWNLLEAGYLENSRFKWFPLANILKNNILFSILFNVYLDELDFFVENLIDEISSKQGGYHIFKKLNTIRQKKHNKIIQLLKSASFLNNKKFNFKELNSAVNYTRYANTWVIGITSDQMSAIKIKIKINSFLKKKLLLTLNSYETKLTYLLNQKTEFLGTFFFTQPRDSFSKTIKSKIVCKNSKNFKIHFHMPTSKIFRIMIDKGFIKIKIINNIKYYIPFAISKWIFLNHKSILLKYNAISEKLFKSYYFVDNITQFWNISYSFLRHSCAKTLGRKFNLHSRAAVFKKFGKNLSEPSWSKSSTKRIELKTTCNFKPKEFCT